MRKRIKRAVGTLRFVWDLLRGVYHYKQNEDRVEELTREIVECEECESHKFCEEHQQKAMELGDEFAK